MRRKCNSSECETSWIFFYLSLTMRTEWRKTITNQCCYDWNYYMVLSPLVLSINWLATSNYKKTGILYNCVFSLHQLQSALCFKWDELKTMYWLFCLFLHFPSSFSAESSTLFFHVFYLTSIHLSSNSKSWMHLWLRIGKWNRLIETLILNIKVIHCVDSYNDSFISKDLTTKI